ncbi:MAG TPA: plastocyanin/azurin family copper-binding protein [Candidatus Nitrosopolaris sp.]|nr:plastocyanin/azurin family copper-binding protein [Candidatus Nitrosopolaris sp.]
MNQKNAFVIVALIVVGATLAAAPTSISYVNVAKAIESSKVTVHAGGGNITAPLTAFAPQQVQISVGQTVMWDNPSVVAEPHTVTFVLDNKTATDIVSPFAVPNSAQLSPIPPGSNNEALKAPGPSNVVIGVNARSYIPTIIDSQGNVKHLPPPNVVYNMTGNEKYVNSGWLIPKGQEKAFPGSSNTFTVTFEKAGTYRYLCEVHPWMLGSVVVK